MEKHAPSTILLWFFYFGIPGKHKIIHLILGFKSNFEETVQGICSCKFHSDTKSSTRNPSCGGEGGACVLLLTGVLGKMETAGWQGCPRGVQLLPNTSHWGPWPISEHEDFPLGKESEHEDLLSMRIFLPWPSHRWNLPSFCWNLLKITLPVLALSSWFPLKII